MITARIFRNDMSEVYGFHVEDHGDTFVCAAVSILVLNTINSIELFTEEHIVYEYEEEGGLIHFELPDIKVGESNHDVKLLLDSLVLGLSGMAEEYSDDIQFLDEEVRKC